ncbi:MAG: PQQ-dependent sugar dehydrogenase [Phycisphaerales bacterium]|nr:PQQ-dependent sugar dehydrogenase [Phycisphaerales bacterium]MCB9855249.1 PQQ-dependent sugar dehydrogenase [Phycisphaerales bacterium]MCB9862842.1 PQQ-dependent sugar dehydrogenase [Phycisphaerales bacterium]
MVGRNGIRIDLVLAVVLGLCGVSALDAAESAPPGFVVEVFATGLESPVALAFAPDGRLFVGERSGSIRIVDRGRVLTDSFADIQVHDFFESGLLGLAVSPNFERDGFVYAFATVTPEEQEILRFRYNGRVGQDRTVLKRSLPTGGAFHNGGGMAFGPDGMLYFSIGDNTQRDNAQSLNTLAGKISRITPDGDTPADNPFATPTGASRAIWAMGFRNPFRFCFAPDGRLFSIDVGSDGFVRREEINLVARGANHGWPVVEGFSGGSTSADAYTDPIYTYHDEGSAPCGIVYYSGSNLPAEYAGNLFHVEYSLERIYRVVLSGNSVVSHELFADVQGGPVDLVQGPDGALYYCELIGGRVMRIRYGEDVSGLIAIDPENVPDNVGDGSDNGDSGSDGGGGPDSVSPGGCAAGAPFFLAATFLCIVGVRRLPHIRRE